MQFITHGTGKTNTIGERNVRFLNGVTGAPVHAGSWGFGGINLPDFGLTEALGNMFGVGQNAGTGGTGLANILSGKSIVAPAYAADSSVVPSSSFSATPQASFGPTPGASGALPQQQVLGASTGPTGSNPPQQNTNTGNNNGGSNSNLPSIDDLISGQMGFLEGLKPQLTQQRDTENAAIDNQYGTQKTNISDQLTKLNNQLGIDTNNFNYGMNSAYSQAQNTYNQLLNRTLALYGGGSSAGPAIASILGQGYQQQGGQLQNQDLSGHQQLGQQGQDITTWGDTQMGNLDTWKNQAHLTINNLAQQGLQQINAAEGATQDQKTADKMQLLQNVINMRQAVEDYHTQLASQIAALQAVQNPGGVSAYNPGNFSQIMSALQGQIAQTPLTLQNSMAQSAGLNPQQAAQFVNGLFNPGFTNGSNTQDQMLGMLGPGFVPGAGQGNNQNQF